MKRDTVSRMISRISRHESLPLLRGMFVFPEQLRRKKNSSHPDLPQISAESTVTPDNTEWVSKLKQRAIDYSCRDEDGLYLTAKEGLYLEG